MCGRAEALRGLPGRLADLLAGLDIGLHIARKALHRLGCILSQRLGIRALLVVLLTAPRGGRTHQQRRQIIITRLIVAILLVLVVLLFVPGRGFRQLLIAVLPLLTLLQLFGQIINALTILTG
ncbi:Uncharacterised protein [Mycobacteroides abscessus subsp. abscessus]|nr:Uncharacterised protein [Mycobacteroides abscessus subsp. abscessus]